MSASLYPEADFKHNLIVSDFAINNMTPGFLYFKPLNVPKFLAAFGDRIFNGILDACFRGTNHFYLFVDMMVGHHTSCFKVVYFQANRLAACNFSLYQ
jgi:hypothetical protein